MSVEERKWGVYNTFDNPSFLDELDEIDIWKKIDNSYNGTCFAYDWFLKLKQSEKILKIYDEKMTLLGFMPVFNSNNSRIIAQSTMYIPYGGPVLFNLPNEERNKIRFIDDCINQKFLDYLDIFIEIEFFNSVTI